MLVQYTFIMPIYAHWLQSVSNNQHHTYFPDNYQTATDPWNHYFIIFWTLLFILVYWVPALSLTGWWKRMKQLLMLLMLVLWTGGLVILRMGRVRLLKGCFGLWSPCILSTMSYYCGCETRNSQHYPYSSPG